MGSEMGEDGTREAGEGLAPTAERRATASATDAAILEIVRRRTETTRVEISRELGVTPATVTYAVRRLLASGLLLESGRARSNGGKRASLLRVNDRAHWAVGCTIDADRLSMVGVDMTGALRSRIVLPIPASAHPAEIRGVLGRALELIDPARELRSTTGIGLATPHLSDGSGQELLRTLTEGLDVPSVSADASVCAALGSFWSGEQAESGLSAVVHVGAQLGLTLMVDGEPLPPSPGRAPTLDHVCADPAGPRCRCGRDGCLHQVASPQAVTARAAATDGLAEALGLELTPSSAMSDAVLVALAAARGEPRSAQLIQDAARALGQAVWSVASAVGAGSVILSGQFVQSAPVLVGETVERAMTVPGPGHDAGIRVTVSQVQPHPCAVGAAVLALQTFLDPHAVRSAPTQRALTLSAPAHRAPAQSG